MKLIFNIATASQIGRESGVGARSAAFRELLADSLPRAIEGLQLQSLPPANRGWLSARVPRADAPAPGPGGVARQMSRLEQANCEWFNWRFPEDA